jgi:UPF0755 protein
VVEPAHAPDVEGAAPDEPSVPAPPAVEPQPPHAADAAPREPLEPAPIQAAGPPPFGLHEPTPADPPSFPDETGFDQPHRADEPVGRQSAAPGYEPAVPAHEPFAGEHEHAASTPAHDPGLEREPRAPHPPAPVAGAAFAAGAADTQDAPPSGASHAGTPAGAGEPAHAAGTQPGADLPPPPSPPPGMGRSAAARAQPPPRSRARLGALVALVAVAIAVALLLFALLHKSHAKPVPVPAIVKVLIPEGSTRLQIAQIARRAGLRGDYRVASRSSPLLDPTQYGAPPHTPHLEGFLFPATYDEYPGALVTRLVSDQLVAFKENFGAHLEARARALHETPYQLLIVASMIEREAQIPSDRAKIAAVIYNRLHAGMPLGVDATIYYALEAKAGIPTYTRELTEAQLHTESAYNTRTHTGLPPTPISNPGLASMEAAANPAHVSYLYYVAGADGCGEHVFTTTLAAFEAAAAAYHAAVQKNGGHAPVCKKK